MTSSMPIMLLCFSSFARQNHHAKKTEDNCTGGKQTKKRVTVTAAANTTGTEKLPPFIIRKSLRPLCLKNIHSLTTDYAANSKAAMTGELFKQWLRKLDRKYELKDQRIQLIVDDC